MTTAMPDRIPLDLPPDDVSALDDLVGAVTRAAVSVAAVDDRLRGAALEAPGWLGDDAAAAAAQIGAVTALVRAVDRALLTAAGRLSSHAQVLREIRHRVSVLQAEQDEQFADAWRRFGQVENLHMQVMVDGPDLRAIVEEIEAGEASRRRRHTALLEELEDDAAATARVLTDSCAVVGGRGSRGDADRVVAFLAAQLPGWGDLELARRGRALADDLLSSLSPGERDERARLALPLADSAAFADALLGALGAGWMRDVLQTLGGGDFGPTSALPQLVASVLGTSARGGGTGPVAEVVAAEYTSADDQSGLDDLAVLGMGVVLSASLALGSRGLDPHTVAAWGRQIALREHVLGAASTDRVNPLGDDAEPVDALAAVVAILGSGNAPTAAAGFLNGPSVWSVLLARPWADCGTSLQGLVASAGAVDGPEGEAVVRGGLEALGARLEDGNADDWPVNRAAANAVSPALAQGLAAHASLVGGLLVSGVGGGLPAADGSLLRGLGYVTLDRDAAGVIEGALAQWVSVQPVPTWVSGPPPSLPAVVVPNAYLAVQDYGQRLAYALSELDAKREADDRAFLWNMTFGWAAELAPGPWGKAAALVEGYVAMWLDLDGTWDSAGDQGLRFAPDAPTAADMADLTPDEWTAVDRMARMAQGSFEGVQQALGRPLPPMSPETHWWGPILDMVMPGPGDLLEQVAGTRPGGRIHLPR